MKKRILSMIMICLLMVGMVITPTAIEADAVTSGKGSKVISGGQKDFGWPVPGNYGISSCFLDGRGHYAIDISAAKGTKVVASYAGTVVATYTSCTHNSSKTYTCCNDGFGNYVVLQHSYKLSTGSTMTLYTRYSHLTSVSVSKGQTVSAGTQVGTIGSTGYSQGNHLDFQILRNGWTNRATNSLDPYMNELLILPSSVYCASTSSCCGVGPTGCCCYYYVQDAKKLYASSGHTYTKGEYKYYWSAHPHYKCYQCTMCDEIKEDKSETVKIEGCEQCYPTKAIITFDANGGTCSTSSKKIDIGGAIGTLPTPTRDGYTFVGWSSSPKSNYHIVDSTFTYDKDTTLYAHWTSGVYNGQKMDFYLEGGTIPSPISSCSIDGYNVPRDSAQLIIYNCDNEYVATNYYGYEVAVNADGYVTAERNYGDNTQLQIPAGGFVVSASGGSSVYVAQIVNDIEVGMYVGYDEAEDMLYVYSSNNAYLANHKYVDTKGTYGILPVPSRDGYVFNGWLDPWDGTANYFDGFESSALIASWTAEGNVKPVVSREYNGKIYELYDCIMSWDDAQAFCEERGGNLVAITDADEQQAVVELITLGERGQYYIGATDEASEGNWVWMSGENFSYSNWDTRAGEPNGGTKANCATIIAVDNPPNKEVGEWNDTSYFDETKTFYHASNVGFVLERESVCAGGHIHGPTCRENIVEATCEKQGSYDSVVYCVDCGIELDRATVIVAKKGHNSTTIKQYIVEATCTEEGSYDSVVYCTNCGIVFSRTTVTVAKKGHTEVADAAVAPSCTKSGLTSGKHCSVCGTVTVEQEVIPAKGHTKGTAKTENEVKATCTTGGSYETVVYCTVCQAEISRVKTTVPDTGHAYDNGVVTTKPGCETTGVKTFTCQNDKTHTYTEVIPATGHTEVKDVAVAPTCEKTGLTEGKHCSTCNKVLTKQGVIPALGHDYVKGVCTRCGDTITCVDATTIKGSNVTSSGKIKLTWDKIDNAAKYQVYRSTSSDGSYSKVGTVTELKFEDSSAVPGKKYYYKVRGLNSAGKAGAFCSAKYLICDCARPTVSIALKSSNNKPRLTWKAVEGAAKYEVYRATSKSGTYKRTFTTESTSYTNTSAKAGTTYYYKVKALCKASSYGDGAFSEIKSIKSK